MKFTPIHNCGLLAATLLSSNSAFAQSLDRIHVARSAHFATEAALWFTNMACLLNCCASLAARSLSAMLNKGPQIYANDM